MSNKQPLRPGMDTPRPGKFTEIGPRGGVKGTVEIQKKGDTMPPTEKPNSIFIKS